MRLTPSLVNETARRNAPLFAEAPSTFDVTHRDHLLAASIPGGSNTRPPFALLLLIGLAPVCTLDVVVPAQAASIERSAVTPYAAYVAEAARRFGIPSTWIRAVMQVESSADRGAVSSKGAMGLMQIMPDTWVELRSRYDLGRDPFDPHDNIFAGAAFLRELHDRYGSPGFLVAYNAGPRRYENYRDGRRPLPSETVAYVTALLPSIASGEGVGPVLTAAPTPSPWTLAPLFAKRTDRTQVADRVTLGRPGTDATALVASHDLSAIAPRSNGLFVALSTTERRQ